MRIIRNETLIAFILFAVLILGTQWDSHRPKKIHYEEMEGYNTRTKQFVTVQVPIEEETYMLQAYNWIYGIGSTFESYRKKRFIDRDPIDMGLWIVVVGEFIGVWFWGCLKFWRDND